MESLPTHQGPPTPFNIYPVLCHLNKKFQTLYVPNQKTANDEGLTLWKECLSGSTYHQKLQSLKQKLSNSVNQLRNFVVFSCIYRKK